MDKKYIAICVLLIIAGGFFVLMQFDDKQYINKIEYNCDNIDVVYLKPSEKSLSGVVARNIKGIAIIPEENYLVADTELLLQCDNIDFSEYLDMGDMAL